MFIKHSLRNPAISRASHQCGFHFRSFQNESRLIFTITRELEEMSTPISPRTQMLKETRGSP